ncbi:MAG: ADP-ribosylation factor family protein [Candidatus Odinarchaeota archaeon]
MSWLKRFFLKTEKKVQISFCGLDAAGKTTILNYLLTGEKTETIPTTGINFERIRLKDKTVFEVYDLPGQKDLRKLWDTHLVKSDLVVFVLDSANKARIDEAKELFWRIYSNQIDSKVPIAILANKQDLPDHLSAVDILDSFDLGELTLTKWQIFGTSALTGKGIIEAFQWIYEIVSGRKVRMKVGLHGLAVLNGSGNTIASSGEVNSKVENQRIINDAFETFSKNDSELVSLVIREKRVVIKRFIDYLIAVIVDKSDDEVIANSIITSLVEKLDTHDSRDFSSILNTFTEQELKLL